MNLIDILNKQTKNLKFSNYENELKTMQNVLSMPTTTLNLTKNWLKCMEQLETVDSLESSTNLRCQGNEALKLKKPLLAADFYTKAIIAAKTDQEALALAHANRAQALLDFGYFSQAYDDCVLSLKYDYPKKLRHKLHLRQATCAAKLNKAQLLQQHMNELKDLPLNAQNQSKLEFLRQQYEQLVSNNKPSIIAESTTRENKLKIKTSFGRCLKANVDIEENELIFTESAYSCVPVEMKKNCQNCLSTLYIPFPCSTCDGNVQYCSLDCCEKDSHMHRFECAGYHLQLFEQIGIGHLALRTVLKGLPDLLNSLKSTSTADDIWKSILESQTNYAETLHLESQFSQIHLENIKYYALLAYALLVYLLEYTDFFTALSLDKNWQVVVSALILRHIGQFIINAHSIITLQPSISVFDEKKWKAPQHLNPGYLHKFNSFGVIAAANFPFLSLANHACKPSFQTIFNGLTVNAFANSAIKRNEEVFNCYTLHYKCSSKLQRLAALEEHNFLCQCKICTLPNPDFYYERLYTFSCEFCSAMFVPGNQQFSNIFNPYEDIERLDLDTILSKPLQCSVCFKNQHLLWYRKFLKFLTKMTSPTSRKELFKMYTCLNLYLPEFNKLHITLGSLIIEQCFEAEERLEDYQLLPEVIEYYLEKIALKSGYFSLEFASQMTYLWDLMAIYKYKCKRELLNHTLKACDLLSNEFQIIFKNYFQDHISDN